MNLLSKVQLSNGAEFNSDLDDICSADLISFDFEYDPTTTPYDDGFSIWGCGFASDRGAFYSTDQEEIVRVLRKHLSDPTKTWVAHNAIHECVVLGALGIGYTEMPVRLLDTMLAMNTLYDFWLPNQLGLKYVIKRLYQYEMQQFKEASAFGPDSSEFHFYGVDDAIWTLQLAKDVTAKLIEEDQYKYVLEILGNACVVFGDIQRFGIKWDDAKSRLLRAKFLEIADEASAKVKSALGWGLNINAPGQISRRLFTDPDGLCIDVEKYKIPLTKGCAAKEYEMRKKGKLQYKTDDKTIFPIAHKYPVCAEILTYKTAVKQVGSYLDKYTNMADKSPDYRIHPRFSLDSATGRTRAADGLQAVPARFKKAIADKFAKGLSVRDCFVADTGFSLFAADFSQIELRLIAVLTKEPAFYDAYRNWDCAVCGASGSNDVLLRKCPDCGADEEEPQPKNGKKGKFWHGRDLHQEQADAIPEVQGSRARGKVLNFSLAYNVGTTRLHTEDPSLSWNQWDKVRDCYLSSKPKLTGWHSRTEIEVRTKQVLRDFFGRKRRFQKKDLATDKWWHTKNQAINFRPQSSACSIGLLGMIKMRKHFIATGDWGVNVKLVHFIHDEILLEIRNGHEERISNDATRICENAVNIGVPIRMEGSFGRSWMEAK